MASSELSFNINIHALKNHHIDILSVYNNKLLLGASSTAALYTLVLEPICNLSIIQLSEVHLYDAIWMSNGNIMYASYDKVVVITESGEVVYETFMPSPRFLTQLRSYSIISGNFYLADYNHGYFESSDEGRTWQRMFRSSGGWPTPSDGWHAKQIVNKYMSITGETWCTIEMRPASPPEYRLRIYRVNKMISSFSSFALSWADVRINSSVVGTQLINLADCKLFFDICFGIFLNDSGNNIVYILSDTFSSADAQILWFKNISSPYVTAMDRNLTQLLFVGQKFGQVGVFKYGSGTSLRPM